MEPIPAGHRYLSEGEFIHETDQYYGRDDHGNSGWVQVPWYWAENILRSHWDVPFNVIRKEAI